MSDSQNGAAIKPSEVSRNYYGWFAVALVAVLLVAASRVVYPIRYLIWHISAIAWWLVLLLCALGQGTFLLRLIGGERIEGDHGNDLAIALGLGLGALSLEAFGLAAVDLMNTRVLTLLALLVLTVSGLAARRPAVILVKGAISEFSRDFREAAVPLYIIAASSVMVFPFVLLPPRSFDALVYHLEVPIRYLQAGGVVQIRENLYSFAPLLTEMLYGIALGLEGVDLAGLVYFSFFLLVLVTLWRGGQARFGNEGGAWTAAFVALTPVFLMEVPRAGSDWSMVFFILTSLFLLAEGKRDTRRMVLAGVLAGMAAGCRHQALGYAIAIPFAVGIADDLIEKRGLPFRPWGLFLAVSILVASPWYIKNLIMTGDPIYPLFSSIAGKTDVGHGFVSGLVGPRPISLLWDWLFFPFRAVFDITHYNMSSTLGVIPLALLPLLPSLRKSGFGSRFLGLWMVFSFAAWYLTFRSFRYVFPVVAVLYLWYGAALSIALSGSKKLKKWLLSAVCIALLANAGIFLGLSDFVDKSVGPALGTRSSENYLMATYEVYPAISYLNNLDPPPGKVLFLGEMRGFYAEFPREISSHNVTNRLIEMAREGLSPDRIRSSLASAGFTHLLANPSEWERMINAGEAKWRVSTKTKVRIRDFLSNYTKPVFSEKGLTVLELTGG